MPAGFRMGFLPLAKAISMITYLRTEVCGTERILARGERSENMGTTRQTPSFREEWKVASVGTWHPLHTPNQSSDALKDFVY
ncbi:hypothetical protein BTVI_62227 [Pitangus sulphuratus]|nr:hypothetical protein BTVI_62227 [Pitangus sulphuratus]